MKRKDPPKQQRNAPCACGSGKKYKKCHLIIEREEDIKAELEWEERRKARAEEIRKMRENDLDTLRAQSRGPAFGTRRNTWLMTALIGASLAASSNKHFK